MIHYLKDAALSLIISQKMGGKAHNLRSLLLEGFSVPAGFVLQNEEPNLEEAVAAIGGFPVAVRSSGSLEDLPNASFAGLYETFLFIQNHEELKNAIYNCFESRHSARVKDYLDTKKIKWTPESLTMSVLVQKMVDAQMAGVLFTMNPTNGFEEEFYAEFCEGVGERLVSGHVTPSQLTYNWQKQIVVKAVTNNEGSVLNDSLMKQLMNESLKIQAYYGKPQDIEWAIDKNGSLFILQSRPITTYTARDDKPELTDADLKDGGISARVCSPGMFSIYREALKNSMGDYFKKIKLIPNDENIQWLHYHYGRVYWNAGAVKEGLKKLPDFKEEAFDRDLGIQKDYGSVGPHHTKTTLSSIMDALPVLIALHQEFRDSSILVSQFKIPFEARDEKLKSELKKIKKMTDEEFCQWLLEVILFQNDTEKKYFRIVYNNSNYQTEFKNMLKKAPGYEMGDEIDLMGELHGVSHLDVQGGLAKLRQASDLYGFDSQMYHSAREDFLRIHYHHGPAELDLTVPRWGEHKEWVDELVRSFTQAASGKPRFEITRHKIWRSFSFLSRGKFISMLECSRDFLRMREEMRAYSTRAYYLLRIAILDFARRNNLSEEDVFMLDILEIKNKSIYPDAVLPDTSLRKAFYRGYRNFSPPHEFGGTISGIKAHPVDGQLKGIGCSPGEIVGRARVILDIHATHELTHEEILVTLFTDPGWTPVLARVGGVITEVGGLLSHAAVIGREYGIPAILNLIDATIHIQDGDLIKMNGKTGLVEILEKGPK